MRIKSVKITGFHNLINLNCDFCDSTAICFIGNNGSGKSSVLEGINDAFYIAKHIATIEPSYNFDIAYNIGADEFRIQCDSSGFTIEKNGKKDIKNIDSNLPKTVFTYYAGETDRLNRFADRYKSERVNYIKSIKQEKDIAEFKFSTSFSLKDFKLAFFVNYLYDTDCFNKIKQYIKFKNVKPNILFRLGKPDWASSRSDKNNLWNAQGFQKEFYEKLITADAEGSSACVRLDEDTKEYQDEIWLGVLHSNVFKKIASSPLDLFIQLKALVDVNLLQDVYITVASIDDKEYDIDFFSEGEKQLTNLIMLLSLTKDYESIYLLDEFDAYLHPNWQRNFVKIISEIDIRGQVIFTTHSPATISGLRQEDVFIMKNGQVFLPTSETYNRALDEIMEEQMEVSMRSKEVDELISKFKQAVTDKDKEGAIKINGKLKDVLAEDDPFLITTRLVLERM